MPRELLSIRKMSDTSNGYYLMQGQDRIAVIVPLSQHVYGPEIVGDLLSAMCELTNDAQDEFETPRIKPDALTAARPVERYCPYCLAGLCANEAFEPEPDDPRTVMIVVPDQCQHTHHDLCDSCGHIAHAYDCLEVTLDRQELGNCKCYIDPQA